MRNYSMFECPTHKSPLHRVGFNTINQDKLKVGKRQGKHVSTQWYYCLKGDHCMKLKVVIAK